eukprot:5909111-Pyramimonas_sp.AAC.1
MRPRAAGAGGAGGIEALVPADVGTLGVGMHRRPPLGFVRKGWGGRPVHVLRGQPARTGVTLSSHRTP